MNRIRYPLAVLFLEAAVFDLDLQPFGKYDYKMGQEEKDEVCKKSSL